MGITTDVIAMMTVIHMRMIPAGTGRSRRVIMIATTCARMMSVRRKDPGHEMTVHISIEALRPGTQ